MATYLFAWELGAGLGHLMNVRPLAEGLAVRGHNVVLALRDLSRAKQLFRGANVSFLQAPFKHRRTEHITPTLSFAHLLDNVGFCDAGELGGMAEAWRSLYQQIEPAVIVFDHSPTALLAARGLPAKRVLLGTGFFCPLDESPLACLRPWLKPDLDQLARDEEALLSTTNHVLTAWRETPLNRVAELYHPSDEHLLVTFPELDHYPARTGARYWGAWCTNLGKPAVWPSGEGEKVFAYLKPFAALPTLLDQFRKSGRPTILYCDGIHEQIQERFQSPNLRFENEPLEMQQIGHECDLAVLNANHGTAVAILLAGKPSLQIPLHLEQSLLASAIVRLGAGLAASPRDPLQILQRLEAVSADERYVQGAARFAKKYANFDSEQAVVAILDRLEHLAMPANKSSRAASKSLGNLEADNQVEELMRQANKSESERRFGEAANSYRQALSINPNHFTACYRLGLVLQQDKRFEEAVVAFEAALRLRPNSSDVENDLGCALWTLGRHEEAAKLFEHVLTAKPEWSNVHNNLGCVFRALGRHQEAIDSYQRALAINANVADFHNNLGCALRADGRPEEGLASYRRAIALRGDFADALSNLGTLLLENDQFEEAIESHRRAIRYQPHNYKVHHNLGAAYLRAGRFEEAVARYDEALGLEPGVAEMEFNRGIACLTLGRFAEGWDGFESRLKSDKYARPAFQQPRWNGAPLADKTLLVYAEQGLGDTIHFVRFVPQLRTLTAKVLVAVQPALVPLLRESRIEGIVPQGTLSLAFDVHAPLLSVPQILGTSRLSIPAKVPYLKPNQRLAERWKQRLADLPGLKVGIHWQGSAKYEGDRWRSIPLQYFEPLARVPGVTLVSLQKNDGTEQIAHGNVNVLELANDLDEAAGAFMDTAAIIQNLDLVITSDSAVAHLAGALGARVWLCLARVADWRWLLDRDDSPWYPTMRLWRQREFGDWSELFERVARELHAQAQSIVQEKTNDRAAASRRSDAERLYRAGLKKQALGQVAAAIEAYRAALEMCPDYPQSHNDLGCALATSDDYAQALGHFRRAVKLKPDFADAHNNLGCALRTAGQLEAAVASFQTAIGLKPNFADAINNMGNALQDQGKLDEAIAAHIQSLALKPGNAEAHNSLGGALQRKGCDAEALTHFETTLRLNPGHIEAQYSRALIRLSKSDFARGWPGFEARQKSKRYRTRNFARPQWDGSSLEGQTLLIHAEQGLGDTLQFIRFVSLARQQASGVIVEVQPTLIPILQQSGFDTLAARGSKLPEFDVQIPLLSLPGILGTTIESIPSPLSYLSVERRRIETWRERLSPFSGFKVGINWQGSVTYKEDRVRSIPLAQFEPLALVPGVTLTSLQKDQGIEQLEGITFPVVDLGGERDISGAFVDTASIIKNLDLVITSDTSIAHLAGALGVPTWVCLSHVADWRWFVDRDDSPWYPSMRLFRQSHRGDWPGVFERVAIALANRTRGQVPPRSGDKSTPAERTIGIPESATPSLAQRRQPCGKPPEAFQFLKKRP